MFRTYKVVFPIVGLASVGFVLTSGILGADDSAPKSGDGDPREQRTIEQRTIEPPSVEQARVRARMLYETVRGTLQIMHRDFFDDEDPHVIPSAAIEEVFEELQIQFGVELKWINVETDVLNIDHQPQGDFERRASQAIAKQEPFFDQLTADRYRYMGRIRLASQCLKCHLKNRRSTKDRSAGLLITVPVRQ